MKLIGKISVFPKLPGAIARLEDLAYNLWWTWEPEAQALFEAVDAERWERVNHNPVRFLRGVEQEKLNAVAEDEAYLAEYEEVLEAFDAYMAEDASTWYSRNHAGEQESVVAYFSAEFGLHEALPIYSGGLGILSGDHCKAASDLGLPFIGVGFLYPQGYFTQRIDREGQQQAEYEKIDFAEVPATPAKGKDGNEIIINVDLPGRTVYAKIWKIQVGRIPIYLMDTDVPRNAPQDRELGARLYGGDREMRLSQEVVLGIGGVRAVRALGYEPSVWHMNEGHSAFLGLERVRELVQQQGLSFDQAVEAVRADSVFTTHTPVPAGNDTFAFEMIEKFFWQYWNQLGVDRDRFINFAVQELAWGSQYSMTVLALKLSAYHNGVSELHGHVSREMWQFLWPEVPIEQVPIDSITNGVHMKTWLVQELRDLYGQHLQSDWLEQIDDPATWRGVDNIPDADLWAIHSERKGQLVKFARERIKRQFMRHGEGPRHMELADTLLDPNALTLGFARRFATYKRAALIFHDEERIKRILNDPARPVQIVFSGKAHPADQPGQALIKRIYELSQQPDFAGKIVFLENYDMNIARHLISGVDVWLNNPRRPREASGTSGQKAAASGVPNFSVLDGWWVEGYNGTNGWAIGDPRDYKDQETQDEADVLNLYATLENEIVPLFYDRNESDLPQGWIKVMKDSIRSCAPEFSMRRMVKDYATELYLPAAASGVRYHADSFALAKEIAAWKQQMRDRWNSVRVEAHVAEDASISVGDTVSLDANVWLNGVPEGDVQVEIVASEQDDAGKLVDPQVVVMENGSSGENGSLRYTGHVHPDASGQLAIGVRVRASHPALINPHETGLAKWA